MKGYVSIIIVFLIVLNAFSLGVLSEPKSTTQNNSYDMVIIAPEYFTSTIQPLIDHKNHYDIPTFLKTTSEIYKEYPGRDNAEQIKYFIKSAIEDHQITYVLLIGGRIGQSFKWHVPCRYSHVDDGYMHKQILSDLYFADIYDDEGEFESWDDNDNDVFAEWTGMMSADDKMDLKPDVSLGRLPCRTKKEVSDIVNKIITYENTIRTKERFNHMLLIGGDTNPGIGDPFPLEGEALCDYTKTLLPNFSFTTLYTSDGTITDVHDFISAFNQGNGLVLYHGHGLQDRLATYKPNSSETVTIIQNDYVADLTNEVLPVTVVGCCQTTDFDVSLFNFLDYFNNKEQHYYFPNFRYECVRECIGWNMVKKPTGGSIAHIGSSSTAWGSTGDTDNDGIPDSAQYGFTSGLCTEFFRIYGREEKSILGDIFKEAMIRVIEDNNAGKNKVQCKCVHEFMLLGDPSLKIGGY